jgi:heme exporter protein A
MVCGLSAPASGQIVWNKTLIAALGEDYNAHLAYVGHLNALKEELDPIENLVLSAKLSGLEHDPASIEAATRYFGLERCARLPCKVLSQGQKRRVALSRLHLSARRALWVLDEPFAALDPVGIAAMRFLLESHLARGGLALLTTHQDVPITASGLQQLDLAA